MTGLEMPTWEEIFNKPPLSTCTAECPPSWCSDTSVAVEVADKEIVRLLGNCCWFDPPIAEEEITTHARRFGIAQRQAEIEVRRARE